MPELMQGFRLGRWREPTEAMVGEAGEKARGEDVAMEVVADGEVVGDTREARAGEEERTRQLRGSCKR